MNDRRVSELLDELSQLCVLSGELKTTQSITNAEEKNSLVMPRIEFSNLDAVYRRIDELAREVGVLPQPEVGIVDASKHPMAAKRSRPADVGKLLIHEFRNC